MGEAVSARLLYYGHLFAWQIIPAWRFGPETNSAWARLLGSRGQVRYASEGFRMGTYGYRLEGFHRLDGKGMARFPPVPLFRPPGPCLWRMAMLMPLSDSPSPTCAKSERVATRNTDAPTSGAQHERRLRSPPGAILGRSSWASRILVSHGISSKTRRYMNLPTNPTQSDARIATLRNPADGLTYGHPPLRGGFCGTAS